MTAPGFVVDHLYTVPGDTQGSWVALTVGPDGRFYVSDQGGKGLFRVTPAPIGSDQPTRVEKLNLPITAAQGAIAVVGVIAFRRGRWKHKAV